MDIIAWIAVGLAAGLLANMLLPGKRSRGLIFTSLTGITTALGGDWTTSLFRSQGRTGGLNPATRRWRTPGRRDIPEGWSCQP
jgi:uncharacterized membrane protein YeaQ/YmgE (transglycosylase-associated protein family)